MTTGIRSGSDHSVTVTLASEKYQETSAEEVTAAWDYENGLLVAQPHQVVKYVYSEGTDTKTYWGYYDLSDGYTLTDMPASQTGTTTATATEGSVPTNSVLPTGTNEDGDSSVSATSSAAVPSSSLSAGHQSLKLSGMLCPSVMGLGLLLQWYHQPLVESRVKHIFRNYSLDLIHPIQTRLIPSQLHSPDKTLYTTPQKHSPLPHPDEPPQSTPPAPQTQPSPPPSTPPPNQTDQYTSTDAPPQ